MFPLHNLKSMIRTIRSFLGPGLIAAGLLMSLFSARAAVANLETVIHSFLGGTDGWSPEGKLIVDEGGNFYGTTNLGGTTCAESTEGCGTVFKITPGGEVTILYSFLGGSDGYTPRDGLLLDSEGNLYGTTADGGDSDLGTAFKLAPDGTKTTLHSFAGGTDGSTPNGDLVADAAGNLYGTTISGGTGMGGSCRDGCGIVFKLTPAGEESVLYSFQGTAQGDGSFPSGGLAIDARGTLYGATSAGGTAGAGTIFRITPRGRERVLYAFAGGSDGDGPNGNLIIGRGGNLFGTTVAGGQRSHSSGTVFKVTTKGVHTVLYSFGSGTDGNTPVAGVVADSAGNLYGTTTSGGVSFLGTVFKVTPDGQETILHYFEGGSDGFAPFAGVTLDGEGKLYGTTIRGGTSDKGVVFNVEI
jgi:uncharacterized repeat protein (TIGR03803 family)